MYFKNRQGHIFSKHDLQGKNSIFESRVRNNFSQNLDPVLFFAKLSNFGRQCKPVYKCPNAQK